MIQHNKKKKAWILSLMIGLFSPSLYAMSVQPLLIEMQSIGRASTATLKVGNEGANPLPVEVVVERLTLNENGESSYEPAEDEWLVFPPQMMIAPGGHQNFRLQWLGEPELKQSHSYHVVVKQVPVKMAKGQSGIQLVYNFRALVNVAPPNSRSELQTVAATLKADEQAQPRISLTLENLAARHALMSNHDLILSLVDAQGKTQWKHKMTAKEVFEQVGAGLVQPGHRRRFILPLDLPEAAKQPGVTVQARVRHAKSY